MNKSRAPKTITDVKLDECINKISVRPKQSGNKDGQYNHQQIALIASTKRQQMAGARERLNA